MVGLVVERVRTLAYRSNVDLVALRRAVRDRIERRRIEEASKVLRAFEPAWAAVAALPLIDPRIDDSERIELLDDRLADARAASLRGMRALRVAATIGSAIGFIGAAIELHWVFNGEHGILGLEAGRIENEGLGRALLSISIGIATSSFALGSWTILRGVALERVAQCRRLVAAVEDALAPINPADCPPES